MILLRAYLSSPKTKKTLARRPGEEGFSLIELVVVIAVLAILSAVAIPAFLGVQSNGQASAAKNALVNGVKECAVNEAGTSGKTKFADVQSFKAVLNGYDTIIKGDLGDSCFSAKATATDLVNQSSFEISLDKSTGITTKKCTKPTKSGSTDGPGCPSNGSW